MASILKHLRSSSADKRPTASGLADGQIAINTASGTPAMFFKDSAGNVVKVGPAHVGTSAPNASPAGSAGNSTGELWVDNSLTTPGLNYYTGSAFVNLTPSGTTSTVGLVELATNAETQAGSDAVRAVTSAGLQSKLSDSTSTTSSTTIASSTAVKSAYDLANAALPKSGGTLAGELLISPSGSLVFEGSSDDSFETTLAVTNPTADRTITFPNVTGTVVTTGDTGSVTSTMIADGTIVNADINASAAIAPSKLGSGALPSGITVASANIVDGTIVNADVNASAAIAGTKISPDFGGQNVVTTGNVTGAALIPSSSTVPTNGVYLPSANNVAISTNGAGALFIDSSGRLLVGNSSSSSLPATPGTAFPSVFQVNSATAGQGSASVIEWSTSTANGGASLKLAKSNSGTVGTIGSAVAANMDIGSIVFQASDGTNFINAAHILVEADANAGTNSMPGRMIFSTTATGASTATERMRITSDGKLGVGTSTPSVKLEVKSPSSATNVLQVTPTTGSGYFRVRETGGNDIDVRLADAAGTESVLINSDGSSYFNGGNVGIGTTSPAGKLSVKVGDEDGNVNTWNSNYFIITSGDSTISHALGLGVNTAGNYSFLSSLQPGTAWKTLKYKAIDHVFEGANDAERARIDSSGRLLVGTSSQSGGSLLQVNDNRIRIATAKTPASATDTGVAGEICWDANYVYVCTATNTWKRTAISTW